MAKRAATLEREAAHRTLAIRAACVNEQTRMNQAISRGARVYITTFLGRRLLKRVTTDWQYHDAAGRSWAGCNDGDWANMMTQAELWRERIFS